MRDPRVLAVIGLVALLAASSAGARQTAERCAAAKAVAAAQLAAARLGCLRAALLHDQPVAGSCVAQAAAKFLGKIERIERKGSCRTGADATTMTGFADTFTGRLEAVLAATPAEAALRVSWTLRSGVNPVACGAVAGQAGMGVILTPTGAGNPIAMGCRASRDRGTCSTSRSGRTRWWW